MQRFDD